MSNEEEPLVTSREVMRAFGIPSNTLYRLAGLGQLPAKEITKPWHKRRRWLFKLSDVAEWLEKNKARRQPPDPDAQP